MIELIAGSVIFGLAALALYMLARANFKLGKAKKSNQVILDAEESHEKVLSRQRDLRNELERLWRRLRRNQSSVQGSSGNKPPTTG